MKRDVRLVGVSRIEPGTVLARDVHTGRYGKAPLLTRGVLLDERRLSALERAGIHAVYIDDVLGSGIEVPQALSEEMRATAAAALDTAFERVLGGESGIADDVSPQTALELDEIARLIADEIAACPDAVFALQDLASADAYTLQHSIDVTALGLLVGRRLFMERGWINYKAERRYDKIGKRLVQLGLGLMLLDIGKLIVPTEILNKPGSLDETEAELVRRHPLAGLDLLASAEISPLSRVVVRSHHERWDGSGYPDGKAGEAIHQFARIAAVADVYDAVTSERPHMRARAPHEGWRIVAEGSGTAFDPEVVTVFQHLVAPYPPGSEIVLDDGRRGVVVSVPETRFGQPLVRIGWDASGRPVAPYELELEKLPEHARAA
jgi:HD-GYP domain-containing protein (c-di-GMP phosphodiesterase class II)